MLTLPSGEQVLKQSCVKPYHGNLKKIIIYYIPFSEFLGESREQLDLLDSLKRKGDEKEIPRNFYFKCYSHPHQE